MKKLTILATLIAMAFAAYASPLPKEKLKKINDYIASQMSDEMKTYIGVAVTSIEKSDATGLLTAINLKIEAMQSALNLKLGAKFVGEDIALNAQLVGNVSAVGLEYSDLTMYLDSLKDKVEKINAKGDYNVTMKIVSDNKATKLNITMVPAREGADLSIKKATVSALIPRDLKNEDVNVVLKGLFKSGAENVKKAQISLTNIINSLIKGEEPSSEDTDVLGDIIRQILASIED